MHDDGDRKITLQETQAAHALPEKIKSRAVADLHLQTCRLAVWLLPRGRGGGGVLPSFGWARGQMDQSLVTV